MKRVFLAMICLAWAPSASAAPVVNNCTAVPPTPRGHIVVRVRESTAVKINEGGKERNRTKLVLEKGKDAKIDPRDEAYVLTCAGEAVQDGEFRIGDVDATQSSGLLAGGWDANALKGAYVAIDTGYASRPPPTQGVRPGYNLSGFITNTVPNGNETTFTLGAGLKDGVFPGDAGYLITRNGNSTTATFSIENVTDQASTIKIAMNSATVRSVDPVSFALKATRKTCSAPSSTFPRFAAPANGNPPAGFIFVNIGAFISSVDEGKGFSTMTMEMDGGIDQGIVPSSSVWIMPQGGANVPLVLDTDVTTVSKTKSRVVISHKHQNQSYNSARTLVSVATCK